MTETDLTPTRQAIAAKDRSSKLVISGKLARALDMMTWGDQTGKPLPWDEAGRTVGISARSMRRSLERPAVRAYLMTQKEVLRTALSARNLFHLDELVSQRENKGAAVQAARTIEGMDAPTPAAMDPRMHPGITIRIIQPSTSPPAIDVTPSVRE
jgi:hypothetical protein